MSKSKVFLIPAALALTCAFGTGLAQARDADVRWSVAIGTPVYSHQQPAYTYPVPDYRQPVPGYANNPYRQPTRWDRDGDGIPNRYDRIYNPVWDRDGDGIPNRRDARYNPRWDRDGDGVPNRHDRDDNVRYDRDGYGYGYGGRR